jgi:DNA-binding transcriptional ArsR family regulator
MPPHDLPPIAVVRTPEAALALMDPERRRLTEALADAPESAAGLARRLGEKRQRINYHLRVLEDAGLVELVEERQRRGRTERILRTTARRFVLDPATVGRLAPAQPDEVGDRFSASYLVALAARAIRELAGLLDRASHTRSRLATWSLNAQVRLGSPVRYAAFVRELEGAVAEVIARHHEERGEGRWFRVVGGAYPGPVPSPIAEESER